MAHFAAAAAAFALPDVSVKSRCCNQGDDNSYISVGEGGGLVSKSGPCSCCTWCCLVVYHCAPEAAGPSPQEQQKTMQAFEQIMQEKVGEQITREVLQDPEYQQVKQGAVFTVDLYRRLSQKTQDVAERVLHTNAQALRTRDLCLHTEPLKIPHQDGQARAAAPGRDNPHGIIVQKKNGSTKPFSIRSLVQELLGLPLNKELSEETAKEVVFDVMTHIAHTLKPVGMQIARDEVTRLALGFLKGRSYDFKQAAQVPAESLAPIAEGDEDVPEQAVGDQGVLRSLLSIVWGD